MAWGVAGVEGRRVQGFGMVMGCVDGSANFGSGVEVRCCAKTLRWTIQLRPSSSFDFRTEDLGANPVIDSVRSAILTQKAPE